MIYYVVIKIIVHLNDFLGNYQIYYANIRFITNYEAINRFTREKERGKEKITFGTGWKIQLVP